MTLNLDVAEQNVQEAINAANSLLPTGLPAPPTYAKINPADQPILTLAITSEFDVADAVAGRRQQPLGAKISEVPGVGLVTPAGGNVPAVSDRSRSAKTRGYGLSIDDCVR